MYIWVWYPECTADIFPSKARGWPSDSNRVALVGTTWYRKYECSAGVAKDALIIAAHIERIVKNNFYSCTKSGSKYNNFANTTAVLDLPVVRKFNQSSRCQAHLLNPSP